MSVTFTRHTAPGVYTNIVDQSFRQVIEGRFRLGLVGVANKGPLNTIISTRSIKGFRAAFGMPLAGHFMANAAAIVAQLSDGVHAVRVGNQYENVDDSCSGTSGAYTVNTVQAARFAAGDYARISQLGKHTTLGRVDTVGGSSITLVSAGDEAMDLQDTYTAAALDRADEADAINAAEGFADKPVWASVGTASFVGTRNQYQGQVDGTTRAALVVGDLLRITQAGRSTTTEIRVKRIRSDNVIEFETSNNTTVGYQRVALQDSYSAGALERVTGYTLAAQLFAASGGDWANAGQLQVRVSPGSQAGTKKLQVFEAGALAETIDNLSDDPASPNYYPTRINGNSNYIVFYVIDEGTFSHLANSLSPWDTVHYGARNIINFTGGQNGSNPSDEDYVGTVNPVDESGTGLKAYDNPDNLDISVLCAPGVTSTAVKQEIDRLCHRLNSVGITDTPDNYTTAEANDWANGVGPNTDGIRLDTYNLAMEYQWFKIIDPYDGITEKWVPPSLGRLRALAYTFENEKPWFASAGENRGLVPEALAVRYPRITQEQRDAMYGEGNVLNPIILTRGKIMVYGNRTMQRAESKLTALNNVILVKHVVKGMATIGRRFVFDPNDPILLEQLRLAFTQFLESVRNERGIEEYKLTMDETKNTPDTRNRREVIVDLQIVPTDAMERLYINATVRESGAQLNEVV